MEYDRYQHVLSWASQQPWALLPEKLAEIRSLLSLRASGLTLTDAEIQARIGPQKPKASARTDGMVAYIPVQGVIAHKMNLMSDISGGTSTEQLSAQIQAAANDPAVLSLLLDVDSPGGGVFGQPELAQTIREARAVKPVIAVANATMASAAYWIGSQASELVVTPSGHVGSIGVFTMHQDQSKALAAEGVDVTVIGAGKFKTERLPFGPLSDEARASIQKDVDTFYGMFVRDVAQGRKVKVSAVQNGFGEGRMLTAEDALAAGMVDRIATLEDIMAELQGKAPAPAMAAQLEPEPIRAFVPSADFLKRRERLERLTRRA